MDVCALELNAVWHLRWPAVFAEFHRTYLSALWYFGYLVGYIVSSIHMYLVLCLHIKNIVEQWYANVCFLFLIKNFMIVYLVYSLNTVMHN